MKTTICLSLLIILFFNSTGLSQTLLKQSNEDEKAPEMGDVLTEVTPVIFVPGIMGSPLYDDVNDNNELILEEEAWFFNLLKLPSMWLKPNGIDPDGNFNIKVSPLRNDLSNTLRNELNNIPMDLYKGFFDNLEANGYTLDNYDDNHNQGENLFCFTYDWRKNNTTTARLLSDFIDSVLIWTGASKVNLVGHSMGGIVSKTCIKFFDNSRIGKVVFIGTPHQGAPEMITVMLKGKLFEWLNIIITDPLVRNLARNLTACYQLIPFSEHFNLTLNNGVSSNIEEYSNCFQVPNGNYLNYSEMINYLKTYTSTFGENLNQNLIDEAEIFKESVNNIEFGEVKVFNIVGHNLATIGKNRVKISQPFNLITIEEYRTLNGDYTVPVRSAELINNQVFEHTYYIPGIIHSALPSSQEVLEILLGVFSNPPITNFPQFSSAPLSYAAPVTSVDDELENPISFYLSQNFPNPFNPVTKINYSIPNLSFIELKVIDVLGKEIITLISEEKAAGYYEIQFNAGDLSSGVYFYKLRAGDFRDTKKLILLR